MGHRRISGPSLAETSLCGARLNGRSCGRISFVALYVRCGWLFLVYVWSRQQIISGTGVDKTWRLVAVLEIEFLHPTCKDILLYSRRN
jgi:hypothetical protein